MYHKLNLKIRLTLIFFLLSLILLESIISCYSISRNLKNNFITFSEEKIKLTVSNLDIHFETVTSFCNQMSHIDNLIEHIKNGKYSLNNLPNLPQSIIGITIYDLENNIYYSNNISNVPSLDTLRTNKKINDFFNSNSLSTYITRTTCIATFYSGLNYDPHYGVISNISKLYVNNELDGYMFIDVRPLYLYTNILDIEDYYSNTCFFINCEDGYLKSIDNPKLSPYLEEVKQNDIISSIDNKYFIFNKSLNNYDFDISVLIGKNNYLYKVFEVIIPILIIDIVFIGLSIFLSIRISKKITGSLIIISKKIKNKQLQ